MIPSRFVELDNMTLMALRPTPTPMIAPVPTWELILQAINAGLLTPNGGSAENVACANRVRNRVVS